MRSLLVVIALVLAGAIPGARLRLAASAGQARVHMAASAGQARVHMAASAGQARVHMVASAGQARVRLAASAGQAQVREPEARTLSGKPLYPPDPIPNRAKLEEDLARALSVTTTAQPEAMITIGRRHAYLWRYREAIDWFTKGIAKYPNDARMYRHRGHRYITTRQFGKARADLERAASLIRGTADQVEPDGAPNPSGIPRSTLHFNVWYHLGLTYYLQGDFTKALEAYRSCLAVSNNDDAVVATSDWLWMTLMRLGRKDDAARVLERIMPKMDILENASYHRRLLMYKGLEKPEALLDPAGADATTIATQGYGVGNYHLVTGDQARARTVFEQVTAGAGWNAFGYIAAEADLARMK